jgi:hypothetical protein
VGKKKRKDAEPLLDPARLEKLQQRLARGELSDADREEVVRLLTLYIDLREKLAGSVPSVKQLRSSLGRRLKGPVSSGDPDA